MTYPLSSTVSAGDATLAAHYNNLRSDALFLGQLPVDVVNLAALLERYESRLTIERLNTDQLRIPASTVEPVSLMVAGCMLQAVANVELAAGDKPSGAAANYFIFANQTAASTTFTITVSTSITEAANQRRIGRFYWDGTAIVKDSITTEQAFFTKTVLSFLEPQTCGGRLTLSTGIPVSIADVSSSGNVYFTPYISSRIALYSAGYGWRLYEFSELTLSLAAVAADKNVDIWIYDAAGTLTLAYTEWSNNTLRATALSRQNGVLVKSNAPAYRYLGTVRTIAGGGATCDTVLKRFVWNFYNRIERQLVVTDDTDSWTYNTATTWRSLNNSSANQVAFVIGVDETLVRLSVQVLAMNSNNNAVAIGICLDNNNANNAKIVRGARLMDPNLAWYGSDYCDRPGLGYHYLQLTEYCGGATMTCYGDKGSAQGGLLQSGAIGSLVL